MNIKQDNMNEKQLKNKEASFEQRRYTILAYLDICFWV